jgi:hypothetical protein
MDTQALTDSQADVETHHQPPTLTVPGEIPCPICHHASQRHWQTSNRWIRECKYCQHRFVAIADPPLDPRQICATPWSPQSGTLLASRTVGYAYDLTQIRRLQRQGQYYGHLLQTYTAPGKVFDMGTGLGFRLRGLMSMGWQVSGFEPNLEMAHYAQQKLGLPVHDCLDLPDPAPEYDVICFIQIISQFADPQSLLTRASQMTKIRGYWLIEASNRNSWRARLLGKTWSEYDRSEVWHWFSPETLIQLCREFGFRPITQGQPPAENPWSLAPLPPDRFWLLLQKIPF